MKIQLEFVSSRVMAKMDEEEKLDYILKAVKEKISQADANALKTKLEEAGAKVVIK